MVDGWICDRCGKTLLVDEDVRYQVEIRVYAPYDVMEITRDDLEKRDLRAEIEEAIGAASNLSEREAADEVYREFQFDLCPTCQKSYVQNPLPGPGTSGG